MVRNYLQFMIRQLNREFHMYQKYLGNFGNPEEERYIPHSPGNEKSKFLIPQGMKKANSSFPGNEKSKFLISPVVGPVIAATPMNRRK
jgi:hypothetical protein